MVLGCGIRSFDAFVCEKSRARVGCSMQVSDDLILRAARDLVARDRNAGVSGLGMWFPVRKSRACVSVS